MLKKVEKISHGRQKLFRPSVVGDYVVRGQFEQKLCNQNSQPILVVTAPAGYGKSSLVSHWIDRSNLSHTWVSTDNKDNDFLILLDNLSFGIRERCAVAAEHLEHLCSSQALPPPELVASVLSADLAEFAEPYAIVLDDYHNIDNRDVHDFVNELLQKRPPNLQLALISRTAPPLSLSRLRSQGLVADVRLGDLRLDREAEGALVKSITSVAVKPEHLDRLHALTEGWPVGLRLLLLASQGKSDLSEYLNAIEGNVWQIQDYLAEECLRELPQEIAGLVLRTSILRRFCTELCDALFETQPGQGSSGNDVVDLMLSMNLFCISLDNNQSWFRHHHLFQKLLLHILDAECSDEEIRSLHERAAAWHDLNESPEEAIYHYLQADDLSSAGEVVSRHGAALKDTQDWQRLDRLLSMIPKETTERNLDLTLLLAWAADKAGRIEQMIELTGHAEEIYRSEPERYAEDKVRLGQICTIRSTIELHLAERETALESARFALDSLPKEFEFDRSVAKFVEAYALQTLGDSSTGMAQLRGALQNQRSVQYRARILYAMCFLDWASGDLAGLDRDSRSLRELGKEGSLQETFMWASWFGGAALYQLNNLGDAASIIQEVIEDPWPADFIAYATCVHIQALMQAASGDIKSARKLASALIDKCTSTRSTSYLPDAQALQAELAFADGDRGSALRWALDGKFQSPILGYMFAAPGLTAARILLNSGSAEGMQKADEILLEYELFYQASHNTRFFIESLALRALWFDRKNDIEPAIKNLERAIRLAEPCGYLRVFADIGPELIPLLGRIDLDEQYLTYLGRIIQAFPAIKDSKSGTREQTIRNLDASSVDVLSKRERDVLTLLAQEFTNKDIGERLFISPATVKRHTQNIYAKLNVGNRRAAAAKALGLGLLSD